MTDLDKLKEAFKEWAYDASGFYECDIQFPERKFDENGYKFRDFDAGAKQAAKLFFPFVAHVLNDPSQSIKHLALINTLKFKLGMKLMAHEEMVGVELTGTSIIKKD